MWTGAPAGPELVTLTSALLQDLASYGYNRALPNQPMGVTSAPYFLSKRYQRLPSLSSQLEGLSTHFPHLSCRLTLESVLCAPRPVDASCMDNPDVI